MILTSILFNVFITNFKHFTCKIKFNITKYVVQFYDNLYLYKFIFMKELGHFP